MYVIKHIKPTEIILTPLKTFSGSQICTHKYVHTYICIVALSASLDRYNRKKN